MSGKPDDWAAGGSRPVGHADGRRTRRSEGRHARPRRSEPDDAPELSLPEPDDDDPTTLAEDAQWAAKLRPGRAPGSADTGPITAETTAHNPPAPPPSSGTGAAWDDPAATGGWGQPSAEPATDHPWNPAAAGGTGEIWTGSPSETTGDPWAPVAPPPAADSWPSSPGGTDSGTGEWSPGIAASGRRPGQRLSDLRYERPARPGADPSTGSWNLDPDTTGSWEPETTWSTAARPSWEEPPAAAPPGPPYPTTPAPEPPAAGPWEPPLPRRPTPPAPASTDPDFGSIFADLAQDRQAEAPSQPAPAPADEDPAVRAAHLEARRLIEHATGQLFQSDPTMAWEQDEPPHTRADEIAEPAVNYGTAPSSGQPRTDPTGGTGLGGPSSFGPGPGATGGGYGPSPDPGGYGPPPGQDSAGSYGAPPTSPGWSDPLPPPPVPDAATPYGAAVSFAPPGSAPADLGGAPPSPPPAGRALSPAQGRDGSADDSYGSGSRLWAPDRRADEEDSGGVGWLWSVEDHGASPQVPRSWVREMPTAPRHDLEGQARPIQSRQRRQLESRSSGRRARHAKRWPVVMAVAAWVLLFAVVCWLYIFPWLERILPENF
jgi:hypothetical protein